MTQRRSRMLGRAVMAWAGLQLVLAARALRRRPWPLALPALLLVAAISALAGWVGYTLATMDWDAPADYPPAEDAADS